MKADPIAIQAERRILLLRGKKVMLDFDLAELYGVEARALNQAVKRNRERFPEDFMFQLSGEEAADLRSQIVTLNSADDENDRSQSVTPSPSTKANSSQTVMSSRKHRGKSYRPYAFTEQGVAMLSSVLRSSRAVQVNIAIMRAFVRLRELLLTNADLARKLDAIEKRYDSQFKVVFDALRQFMTPPDPPRRRIGFKAGEES